LRAERLGEGEVGPAAAVRLERLELEESELRERRRACACDFDPVEPTSVVGVTGIESGNAASG
jgi:hypothetical protein